MMNNLFKRFVYAFNGIAVAIREQANLKIHLAISVFVTLAGLYFKITLVEWSLLLLCIGLVLGLEIMNTAIEEAVNLVTKEQIPAAGKIKDMAAGAVLVASIIAAIVGGLIFKSYIFSVL